MNHPESLEQQALMNWAGRVKLPPAPDVQPGSFIADYLFAIPNGGKRSPIEAGIMKAEGVKPGVSDLFLPLARQHRHGLWIEMKSDLGRTTPDQAAWLVRMKVAGYLGHIAFGWDSARRIIELYIGTRVILDGEEFGVMTVPAPL